MNLQLDINTVVNGVTVIFIVWGANFMRLVEIRLTRIETILKIQNPNEKSN